MKLSVAIIAQDEQEVLPFTLECLVPLVDVLKEVVIVNGGEWGDATDRAISPYRSLLPCRTHNRKFDTFRNQKIYAIDQCQGDYILALDADMCINSLVFGYMFRQGFFAKRPVWDFSLMYSKGDLKHYCTKSTDGMGTTRLFANAGIRYERDVHEYLVMPGETGWDSIHNERTIMATGAVVILETSML